MADAMQSAWPSRLFFAVVAAIAVAGLVSGAACTRWGQPGPAIPSLAPLMTLFVDPHTGSDATGNGTQTRPYKTLTKAVDVLAAAKVLSPNGVTISLLSGEYTKANGESFPIVVPKSVTIAGTNYGRGAKAGSFISGFGEDTNFERTVGAPPRSYFATLETAPGVDLNLNNVYVGATSLSLPSSRAGYVSFDTFGTSVVTEATFGAGIVPLKRNASAVLDAGGSFSCGSCEIRGNAFAVGGIAVPIATSSPSVVFPSITLTHSGGDSAVAAKVVDIVTDGNVDVTSSGQTFAGGARAFEDSLPPILSSATRGAIDFGGGIASSPGGNIFIGARTTEISITRRFETVSALDNVWNPNQQRANRHGQYIRKITFGSGTFGRNVTIVRSASGSTVTVGPAPVPTPTPSITPSGSPGPTATPT